MTIYKELNPLTFIFSQFAEILKFSIIPRGLRFIDFGQILIKFDNEKMKVVEIYIKFNKIYKHDNYNIFQSYKIMKII